MSTTIKRQSIKILNARRTYLLICLFAIISIVAGCGGTSGSGHWSPPSNPDTTAPMVTAVVPLNNGADVAINTKVITAAFSKAMDPATLTTTSFTLSCRLPDGTHETETGAVTYLAAGFVATLRLPLASPDLPRNTVCTATITNGAKDNVGNKLASDFVWTFNTGSSPDVAPPTVPANNATNVLINTKITVTFNKDMDPTTINTDTFTVSASGTFKVSALGTNNIAGTVTYSVGSRTAIFTPTADLTAGATYTAIISTGAKDLAGNALESDYVWTFTTGVTADTTAPTVISVVPLNGDAAVAFNSKPAITFSEPMDPSTITTTTFALRKGATIVPGTVTYFGVIAVFSPTSNLAPNTLYTATITTAARDLAGNVLASAFVWSFTTGAAPDTTAPVVTSVIPVHNAAGVLTNTKITAIFSESMDPATINTSTFTLMNGATSVSGTVTYSGVTAVFTPISNLANDTLYIATITAGAKDLAGNALLSN